MISKLSTGHTDLNTFLNNGYEKDIITCIYGPAGAGKTLLCTLASIALKDKKTIYIDTEGGFSIERLKQITPEYESILKNIVFLNPTSFESQKECFEKLKTLINDKIGLIVVDTISMLYRTELGNRKDPFELNRELGSQVSFLSDIARNHNIPILIANQVYENLNKQQTSIVGGDILRYSAKCLLEIKKLHKNKRVLIIKKHRSIPEDQVLYFDIVNEGIKKFNYKDISSA